MSGRTGLEVADEFHAHRAHVPALLVTAFLTQSLEAQVRERPYLRIVQKPVDYNAIHALIHELVQNHDQVAPRS